MKGVRLIFDSGVVAEFTHGPQCIQPADAWIEAHKRQATTARVEVFESDLPVDRTRYADGTVEDRLSEIK
jgi:hypothetical protein